MLALFGTHTVAHHVNFCYVMADEKQCWGEEQSRHDTVATDVREVIHGYEDRHPLTHTG